MFWSGYIKHTINEPNLVQKPQFLGGKNHFKWGQNPNQVFILIMAVECGFIGGVVLVVWSDKPTVRVIAQTSSEHRPGQPGNQTAEASLAKFQLRSVFFL